MAKIEVNTDYELLQIIQDFTNPCEIFREAIQNSFNAEAKNVYIKVYKDKSVGGGDLVIEILDDGNGLPSNEVKYFFDLANSTNIDFSTYRRKDKTKYGYKGHGTKIYFNSDNLEIVSKVKDKLAWKAEMSHAVEQLRRGNSPTYTDPVEISKDDTKKIFESWDHGMFIRITGHASFKTKYNTEALLHIALRDYCMWYTVAGAVRDFDKNAPYLYLSGLQIEDFEQNVAPKIRPKLNFESVKLCGDESKYEKIKFGHYFPEKRTTDQQMKKFANDLGTKADYYKFFSNIIIDEDITEGSTTAHITVSLEGSETQRAYNPLLSQRGKKKTSNTYTFAERYGLWACVGGVPIQKVDEWIVGGHGVGTYTYLHAFIDCDEFDLTANRGSIDNTNPEILNAVENIVADVFERSVIQESIEERKFYENMETKITKIEDDEKKLKERFDAASKKKEIELPNGKTIKEPGVLKKRRGYNESETLMVLDKVMYDYPDLFPFTLMDYDTTSGIDFVIKDQKGDAKYIELKGTLNRQMNHPIPLMKYIICYEVGLSDGEQIKDELNDVEYTLRVNKNDTWGNPRGTGTYDGKPYKSFSLNSDGANADKIQVFELKSILTDVLGAKIN